jgi:hypothetical protein
LNNPIKDLIFKGNAKDENNATNKTKHNYKEIEEFILTIKKMLNYEHNKTEYKDIIDDYKTLRNKFAKGSDEYIVRKNGII